jgi:hypothetical protein
VAVTAHVCPTPAELTIRLPLRRTSGPQCLLMNEYPAGLASPVRSGGLADAAERRRWQASGSEKELSMIGVRRRLQQERTVAATHRASA